MENLSPYHRKMVQAVHFLLNQPVDYTDAFTNTTWENLYARWARIRARLRAIESGRAAAIEYNERVQLERDIKRAKKHLASEYLDKAERGSE